MVAGVDKLGRAGQGARGMALQPLRAPSYFDPVSARTADDYDSFRRRAPTLISFGPKSSRPRVYYWSSSLAPPASLSAKAATVFA